MGKYMWPFFKFLGVNTIIPGRISSLGVDAHFILEICMQIVGFYPEFYRCI